MAQIHLSANLSSIRLLRFAIAAVGLLCLAGASAPRAWAQPPDNDPADHAWQAGAIGHAQAMRAFHDMDQGAQVTPPVIPQLETDFDRTGKISTYQPGGATVTADNPFFQDLGTNERTCFTCHQPQTGWTVSAASVQARFYASFGTDPIFRLVDGATCPTDKVATIEDKRDAYSLLMEKGLIRIGLAIPATAQYQIA